MKSSDFFKSELLKIEENGLERNIRNIEKSEGKYIYINGKKYIDFSSNNYLGLRDDERVKEGAIEAVKKYGAGSGASRIVTGTAEIYRTLEDKLAEFKNKERALLFNSGYDANVALFSSIFDSKDVVFADRLVHASIIDGIKLGGAKMIRFKHNDIEELEEKIEKYGHLYKKIGVVTESVFSMDGDIGKLSEIAKLKEKYGFIYIVDEAHATGIFGRRGSGIVEEKNIENSVDIVMGTLGKALGSYGAYACVDRDTARYLTNRARPFIFSTALPPSAVGAAIKAVEIVEKESELREKLKSNYRYMHEKIEMSGFKNISSTQIIPVIIGENRKTMEIQKKLEEAGVIAAGIRPPTVPEGSARLRITVNALHTKEEIDFLISKINEQI